MTHKSEVECTPTPETALVERSSSVSTPLEEAPQAVVFLREEGEGPFVPFYHNRSITLREVQEEFHISSVLECDPGGTVLPRAVAFESPSDVLRSGRHYIARRDWQQEEGVNRVTFRSKILVKEYDLDTPGSGTPSSMSSSAHVHRPLTPLPKRRQNTSLVLMEKENVGLQGRGKRGREEEAPNLRFIPFTADVDGSGKQRMVTLEMLRELCDNVTAQEAAFQQTHDESKSILSSARRLFVEEEE